MNRDIDILTTMRLQGMPAVDIEYVRRAFLERNASPAATPAPVAQKVQDYKCIDDGGACGLGGYCEKCPHTKHERIAAAQAQESATWTDEQVQESATWTDEQVRAVHEEADRFLGEFKQKPQANGEGK